MFENLFRFRFIYDWVSEHWNITQDISIRGAGNGVKDTDWEWLLVGRQSRCGEWVGRSEGRTLCWCLNISVFYVWAFNWILNRPDRVWRAAGSSYYHRLTTLISPGHNMTEKCSHTNLQPCWSLSSSTINNIWSWRVGWNILIQQNSLQPFPCDLNKIYCCLLD